MQTVDYLIDYLLNENKEVTIDKMPKTSEDKFNLYRSLCNVREAKPISEEYLKQEKTYLEEINGQKQIQSFSDIETLDVAYPENTIKNSDIMALWRGDITTLKLDAIVNAANSRGLGCFIPGHNCIDNQINTYAGVALRLECDRHMKTINYNLPTGEAFITQGYNLPAKHVIHTVGPIIQNKVTDTDKKLLSDCYKNSLKTAHENNIKTIAFCSISTGVFRFPKDLACQIAIKSVEEYLEENRESFEKIVFNVYSKGALDIYERFVTKN